MLKELEEITVTPNSSSFYVNNAIWQTEEDALDYVINLEKSDLSESSVTGDTHGLINQALGYLQDVNEIVSLETKDLYLTVLGRMCHNTSWRFDHKSFANFSEQDLLTGRRLYQLFMQDGKVLENRDNTMVYPGHSEEPIEKVSFLESIFNRLFLNDHIEEDGVRYKLDDENAQIQRDTGRNPMQKFWRNVNPYRGSD